MLAGEPRHAAGRRRLRGIDGSGCRSSGSIRRCASASRPTGRPSRSASAISCCSRRATRARVFAGLGVVAGRCRPVPRRVRVPQFGWNEVEAGDDCHLLDSGYAYFANCYRATAAPGWQVATAEHGGRFVAAMERGNVIGLPVPSRAFGRLRRGAAVALPGARLMLTKRIIPCLDVSHGRVVKGIRFQGLRDAGDPVELALALPAAGRRRDRHSRHLRDARGPRPPARDGRARCARASAFR